VDVPQKTRDDLEWSYVLDALATGCQSKRGRLVAARLPTLRHRESLERRHREVEEAVSLLSGEDVPSVSGLQGLGENLDRARRGGVLEPEGLLAVAVCATVATDLRRCIAGQRERAPLLHQLADDLLGLTDVIRAVQRAIEPDGRIADGASPDLGDLRRRARSYHGRVRARIQAFLKDSDFQTFLQDDYFTLRSERYVLPVRSGEKGNVPGIVHGTSQTGQTIYIEPMAIVEMNNELRLAELDVGEEERRILTRLSHLVAQHADALQSNEDLMVFLDVTLAMGRLSLRLDARRPALSKGSVLALRKARHPALVLRAQSAEAAFEVIPNDIELDEDTRVMVISGPNTGGKTVSLKTIGLSCLMARAGLHISAGPGSCVPLINGLFSDIGDDQSLERDLSTFSAHVVNIAGFLDRVGPGCVVLLDELFAGTDPGQGAALATALLERLAARGALVAITTHLEALKTVAFHTAHFANASMGFDLTGLAPTYRMTPGLPGSSYALRIAQRLGFPPSLIERAQELTTPDTSDMEPILRQLEDTQRRLADKEADLDRARQELNRKQTELDRELRKLKTRDRAVVHDEANLLLDEMNKTRERLREHTRRLQAGDPADVDHEMVQRIRAEIEAKAQEIEARARATQPPSKQGDRGVINNPTVGDEAWVNTFRRKGTILEVTPTKIVVQVGRIRASVGPEELRTLTDDERTRPAKAPTTAQSTDPAATDDVIGAQTEENTLDLRGLRVDEALERLELFLAAQFREECAGVYIIHGHGTGALKHAVRQLLPSSRYVRKFRAGDRTEGGDGVTTVWLG
jgi:DNA mismatch repair protein MutS2